MIRPTVASITSLKFDFPSISPADLTDFEEWLEIDIEAPSAEGEPAENTGDEFRVCVISPSRLNAKVNGKNVVWGRPYLLMDRWDAQRIRIAIDDIVSSCWSPSYPQTICLLSRFLWVDVMDANPDR